MAKKVWNGKYPVRCRIVDVVGQKIGPFELKTPDESKPFIGAAGLAEEIPDDEMEYRVKITLDEGHVIYGDECWWEPLEG